MVTHSDRSLWLFMLYKSGQHNESCATGCAAKNVVSALGLRFCAGVTGQRQTNEARVEGLISLLHSVTDKSVAVGFGVSGPEQARSGPHTIQAHRV